MAVDSERQGQSEFSVTAAFSALGTQCHGRFATGQKDGRLGEGAVAQGDLAGKCGMHQRHVAGFAFHRVRQDIGRHAMGAGNLGGRLQRHARGSDDEMFVVGKEWIVRPRRIGCGRIEMCDHRRRQGKFVLFDDGQRVMPGRGIRNGQTGGDDGGNLATIVAIRSLRRVVNGRSA